MKQGTVAARYTKFYVTCQHSIQEFFKNEADQKDIDAVKRRFQEIEVKREREIIEISDDVVVKEEDDEDDGIGRK